MTCGVGSSTSNNAVDIHQSLYNIHNKQINYSLAMKSKFKTQEAKLSLG